MLKEAFEKRREAEVAANNAVINFEKEKSLFQEVLKKYLQNFCRKVYNHCLDEGDFVSEYIPLWVGKPFKIRGFGYNGKELYAECVGEAVGDEYNKVNSFRIPISRIVVKKKIIV